MIRDLTDGDIETITEILSGKSIHDYPSLTLETLLKRLGSEPPKDILVNTSVTIYRYQKEYIDKKENASLFIRKCIDYYLNHKEKD